MLTNIKISNIWLSIIYKISVSLVGFVAGLSVTKENKFIISFFKKNKN